ncbi:MAG: hypothetical protein K9M45_06270 [Kiritimatiellales bacterium]|nr:hypothetical protein [Kiritimatiellales bacterium]
MKHLIRLLFLLNCAFLTVPGNAADRGIQFMQPRPEGILTHIPSPAGGETGIAVRITLPEKPRYKTGAPVAIAVSGGHSAGNATSRMGASECGFVEIAFAFPGGGRADASSGGIYDHRGANCVEALRDVILFSMDKITDNQGRRLSDLAGDIEILTGNVGLYGASHGGNACGAVMGLWGGRFPDLAWYVSMESPYGEGAVGVELGGRGSTLNPAYDPTTGVLDLSKLAFDPQLPLSPRGSRSGKPAMTLNGGFYFDINGNGSYDAEQDYSQPGLLLEMDEGARLWYSIRLLHETEKRGLLADQRPAHIPTLKEAVEFWRYRDATGLVPDAVRNLPHLAVLVMAGETDHVQLAPDHPHIRAQINAFVGAGAKFVRLNPDRAYVEWLMDRTTGSIPDNNAGLEYSPQTIQAGLVPDNAAPKQILTVASICELADRTQTGDFSLNLDHALFADAPKSARPPQRPRSRPDRLQRKAPNRDNGFPERAGKKQAAATVEKPVGINVAAPGPKFETEPVELNPNAGMEADSRTEDYQLLPLPGGKPSGKLFFVSPGAEGSSHAAKIVFENHQGGIFSRNVPVDKGHSMTFSIRLRAAGIESVELVAVPVPRGQNAMKRGKNKQRPARSVPTARSPAMKGSFGWTTLRLAASFNGNLDEASFQVVARGPGTVWIDDFSIAVDWPKIVEIPDKPVAPLLVAVMMHSETPQAYIHNRDYFRADAMKYEEMAGMLQRYGAKLVAQPERELWLGAEKHDPGFIKRLHEKYNVSFSVHTHGPNPRDHPPRQEVLDYIKLRKDELEALGAGPVTDLNGNFPQPDWDIFADVGIRTMTAYKNTETQTGTMAMEHYYRHPWRPDASPYEGEEQWAQHRPENRVVYLPGAGAVHTRHHSGFADLMERHLRVALSRVRADRVNVFYFVEHVGRFTSDTRQSPWEYVNSQAFHADLEQHEKLYRDFLAPLVKSGHIKFVVPAEMCDAFEAWEKHAMMAEKKKPEGYISFPINIHDIVHVDQSADLLLKLIGLFETHGVRGDFYLTAPITQMYVEQRPDLIKRLRESEMEISYHVRPPHPVYIGFSEPLANLDDRQLKETLRDYETYRLDMKTGGLLRDQPGGYQFVAETFGRKPVAIGLPAKGARLRRTAREIYRELGAKVIVEHHESGTTMEQPFEFLDGLLLRPSDFSVTRWSLPDGNERLNGKDQFWWNMLDTPQASEYTPVAYLEKRLNAWEGTRPPFITSLIHENNFYGRQTPFTLIYWSDSRKTNPLKPPYNLEARDGSTPRSDKNMQQIMEAYEAIIAYAAMNLEVVTSADIAHMAK